MNITQKIDIINFDKKIQKVYKTADIGETDFDPIQPDGLYNATCTLFITKDDTTCVLGYCSGAYEQVNNPKTILYFDKGEKGLNEDFVELHLFGSNGSYYIYWTKIIEYMNKEYYLLDINNLKANEYNGDNEFYFFDYSRGVKSDILTTYTYWAASNGLIYNQFDSFTTDKASEEFLITDYRGNPLFKKESPLLQNITLNENQFISGGYTTNSVGSKIYNLLDYNNNNYSYNNFNFNEKKIIELTTTNTWTYYKNNQIYNSNNFAYNTNGTFRQCIGQNEVIDFNYNDYINFEAPYISYELVLLPVQTPIETETTLKIFSPLENLNLSATLTLGAVFGMPICILFIYFIRKCII